MTSSDGSSARPPVSGDDDRSAERPSPGRIILINTVVTGKRLDWPERSPTDIGAAPDVFDGTFESFCLDVAPEDLPRLRRAVERSAREGTAFQLSYRTAGRGKASPRWIEAVGERRMLGGQDVLDLACVDISDCLANRRDLDLRLRQQRSVAEFANDAFAKDGLADVMDRAVILASELFAAPLAKILRFADTADNLLLAAGIGWQEGAVGQARVGIDDQSQAGFTLRNAAPVIVDDLRTETRFNGPPLLVEHGVRSGMSVVIPGSESRPFGVFGVHSRAVRAFGQADTALLLMLANIVAASARRNQDLARRKALMREMAHRSGNLMQVVSSIANQTFQSGIDTSEARRAFSERLGSLARANYLIAQGGWSETRFRALLQETLEPFLDRLRLEGRDVMLPPELSFDLALVLHELAAGSARQGSLAHAGGNKVTIRWSITGGEDSDQFACEWLDPDGRPDPPAGGGFGSRLFDGLIVRKWGGTRSSAHEDGLRFHLAVPLPKETAADQAFEP